MAVRIEKEAVFSGFVPEDFELFEVPGFAARMPLLREHIKPKLMGLAARLPERLSEMLGEPVYPHVAQHLRRTVNAPVETWTAFAESPRAYKPFVHLRVAVSVDRVRVMVFVEDYADEKQVFADGLERNAEALAAYFAHHPTIHAYELLDADGCPKSGTALDAATLREFAARMRRVKGQHAKFGVQLDKSHPVLLSGPEFLDAVVAAAVTLKPLYDCGNVGFVYTYTPEIISI